MVEPPPETTRLRLARTTSICQAPQYVAEALFAAEGFTEVQFVGEAAATDRTLVSGEAQLGMFFLGPFLLRLDEGAPLVILAGGHVGCLQLFAHEPIRAIRDLKGRRVAVVALGSARHVFLATTGQEPECEQKPYAVIESPRLGAAHVTASLTPVRPAADQIP